MVPVELAALDGVRLEAAVHFPGSAHARGTVVQVHGISDGMDRGALTGESAGRLAERGFCALRFSFRGHGGSGGDPRGATIAGEQLDLQAALGFAERELPGPYSVVAAGFGAVPVSLALPYVAERLRGLVLWSPVLDLRHTLADLGPAQRDVLRREGRLVGDDGFELGWVLFEELNAYRPLDAFVAGDVAGLVVHGDRDGSVSYEIARAAAAAKLRCGFHTLAGAGHGLDSPARRAEATAVTADWLTRRHAVT